MGMRENWKLFIDTTKNKGKGHAKSAQYWDTIGMVLSLLLIFLGSVTTFMALVKVKTTIVAGIAAVGTMLSAIQAFLKPADRRQQQSAAAREFQELMLKMVRCEDELIYEELWRDLNKAIVDAPFLAKRFRTDVDIEWTMTPELDKLIDEKEGEQPLPNESFNGSNSSPNAASIPPRSPKDANNQGKDNFGYGSMATNMNSLNGGKNEDDEKIELLAHQ